MSINVDTHYRAYMKTDKRKIITYKLHSAAEHKFITYLNTLVQKPEFVEEIKRLREKYGVPIEGYSDYFTDPNDESEEDPLVVTPPVLDNMNFFNDAVDLSREYGLPSDWSGVVENLVAYDEFDFGDYDLNTIRVCDATYFDGLQDIAKDTPVAVLINPYSSQRDVIDFIKKNYKEKIKPIQDKYRNHKVDFGKTRKKNFKVQSIEDFVYENRDLKIMELTSAVNAKFGKLYEYTHVQKIRKAEIIRKDSPQSTVLT